MTGDEVDKPDEGPWAIDAPLLSYPCRLCYLLVVGWACPSYWMVWKTRGMSLYLAVFVKRVSGSKRIPVRIV
jgi:hypothetical protein